jgi:hypothetical protein
MGVYEIPPELAAKYIPPNRLGRGCGPWVQVLGQEPVVGQGAYFKSRGYRISSYHDHTCTSSGATPQAVEAGEIDPSMNPWVLPSTYESVVAASPIIRVV